jgi:hypothetical protein
MASLAPLDSLAATLRCYLPVRLGLLAVRVTLDLLEPWVQQARSVPSDLLVLSVLLELLVLLVPLATLVILARLVSLVLKAIGATRAMLVQWAR